jgi:hypothetical protein
MPIQDHKLLILFLTYKPFFIFQAQLAAITTSNITFTNQPASFFKKGINVSLLLNTSIIIQIIDTRNKLLLSIAKGLMCMDCMNSPFNSRMVALVEPHEGQGIPNTLLTGHTTNSDKEAGK